MNLMSFKVASGSSPLARGLLDLGAGPGEDERIIPARAGFTPEVAARDGVDADHPRSRGVYGASWAYNVDREGSSPLARGLHPDRGADRGRMGIIPARAGFTPAFEARKRFAAGSSPLARGLHGSGPTLLEATGIIPARAGFTLAVTVGTATIADHPRSRGVYARALTGAPNVAGSSPLARGLLDVLLRIC